MQHYTKGRFCSSQECCCVKHPLAPLAAFFFLWHLPHTSYSSYKLIMRIAFVEFLRLFQYQYGRGGQMPASQDDEEEGNLEGAVGLFHCSIVIPRYSKCLYYVELCQKGMAAYRDSQNLCGITLWNQIKSFGQGRGSARVKSGSILDSEIFWVFHGACRFAMICNDLHIFVTVHDIWLKIGLQVAIVSLNHIELYDSYVV